jgi:putative redox protein
MTTTVAPDRRMLTATARSVPGTLVQEVAVGGHRLVTDEPERLGGSGTAPAPHELLPAALASCVSTMIVMYARTKGWELGDVTVTVAYEPDATPRRFDVVTRFGGDLTPEQLVRLERVAATCPVRRALESEVVFHETLETPSLGRAA